MAEGPLDAMACRWLARDPAISICGTTSLASLEAEAVQGYANVMLHVDGDVESAGGAPAVGSGGLSVAFAPGRSPASLTVFPPAAHRTGRAALPHPALQADHATRTRTTASPHGASPVQRLARSLFPLHDLSPLIIRPVYALIIPRGVPSMPHGSFTFACDAAEVSDHLPV